MAESKSRYAYAQTSEVAIISEKIVDHCKVVQRIMVGKRSVYGLTEIETLWFEAVGTLAGQLTGSMKIESEELMGRKIEDRVQTIALMLMWKGSGVTADYERTTQEELLWNAIRSVVKGRSPYVPQ